MNQLARYAAGYVLDFFRARVTAEELRSLGVRKVLVAPGFDPDALALLRRAFPEAEFRSLDPNGGVYPLRRMRFDLACVPMTGGNARGRLMALLSGARHKLLVPSLDYLYRFGLRDGWPALWWAVVDRFLLAPLALVWLGASALGAHAGGLVAGAAQAQRDDGPVRCLLAIRLVPNTVFLRLLRRLRARYPEAEIVAVIASSEGETELARVVDDVICAERCSALGLVRLVRSVRADLALVAGGAAYGFGPTYCKAMALARLSGARRKRHWECGERLPGRPLRARPRRAHRRTAQWEKPERNLGFLGLLARPWLRRSYHRPPRRGPRLVQIGVTEACNYHCLMCPFHNPAVEGEHKEAELPRLSYEIFVRLLIDLKRMGTRALEICGNGEPLMHARAMDMIALARGMGFEVSLATNGALLSEHRARTLVDLGLQRLHVSINAGSEATYGRMHPGTSPGDFQALLNRLRGMADHAEATGQSPVDIEFSAVLTRLNMGEIVDMVEAARLARARLLMVIRMGPARGQHHLLPGEDDWPAIQEQIGRASKLAEQYGISTNLGAWPAIGGTAGTARVYDLIPCYIGHEFALVLGGGDVIFCCHCLAPIGNLHQESFAAIWNSEKYRQAREQAMALPVTSQALPTCGCFHACSHVPDNIRIHAQLHGNRAVRSLA